MERNFCAVLSELRRSRGLSQRSAASDLGISQALLSHYENGAREPGLNFVCRACDYYGVSADYLLGRTAVADCYDVNLERIGNFVSELRSLVDQAEKFTEGHMK